MNERKKPGPKPKLRPVLEGGDVPPINDYPDAGAVRMTIDEVVADIGNGVRVMLTVDKTARDVAQAYAMRVWNGQSDTVIRQERIARVKAALEGQNLPFDGVVLPEAV